MKVPCFQLHRISGRYPASGDNPERQYALPVTDRLRPHEGGFLRSDFCVVKPGNSCKPQYVYAKCIYNGNNWYILKESLDVKVFSLPEFTEKQCQKQGFTHFPPSFPHA